MTDATNPALNFPTHLNGYMVLEAAYTPPARATRAGYVVLVDRGADRDFHRYVTAWAGEGDTSWNQGHYFTDKHEARVDYCARRRRGY